MRRRSYYNAVAYHLPLNENKSKERLPLEIKMNIETQVSLHDIATLSALASGIIPADERDAGATAVHAGPSIAARMRFSPYADIYVDGLRKANGWAITGFNCQVSELNQTQMQELMKDLSQQAPAFFRQLRADVCVIYLSDPGVQQRIGFPGPSSNDGGYPDFDQPQ